MNLELVEINSQISAIEKSLEALKQRKQDVARHERDASTINADEVLIKDDSDPCNVNYIMGQSAGYVGGYQAAINSIICSLASEYRDIPMTESELYMLVVLGEMKERAWLKDRKQKEILEKSGWEQKYHDFVPTWEKKPKSMSVENDGV